MLTQWEAMQRFLEMMKPLIFGNYSSKYKTVDEVLEDGVTLLEAFSANPERHRAALKTMLHGICTQYAVFPLAPMGRVIYKIGLGGAPNFKKLREIEGIRDDLLASVNPGDFGVDILPPREKQDSGASRLVVFQVNVSIYPLRDFE